MAASRQANLGEIAPVVAQGARISRVSLVFEQPVLKGRGPPAPRRVFVGWRERCSFGRWPLPRTRNVFYKVEFAALHGSAILLSVCLLLASWKASAVGRMLYILLFCWAAVVNWHTALTRPSAYLEYAPLAVLKPYADFIETGFARHLVPIVGTIATCQGLIALGLFLGGLLARLAAAGAIVFLIAIAPLGVGSGFPATLILAWGMWLVGAHDALAVSLPRALAKAWCKLDSWRARERVTPARSR